ncbi:MAG: peptidoglycan DD-metalloendopeptidase family protein [Turicibacter sp.]|nr:peptidoglycan DD-metalloendopeptidase family protein [Turicibacter sp.]
MFKRIGIALLLAFTMLLALLHLETENPTVVAYASPTCSSVSECADLATEARDSITELVGQENELSDDIARLNAEITDLRTTNDGLEFSISAAMIDIANLEIEIAENREWLAETEIEIEGLLDAVAARMRLTQQIDGINPIALILTENDDLTDIIAQIRFFSRIVATDADIMDQLVALVGTYDTIIEDLAYQAEMLAATRASLEIEQSVLIANQNDLLFLEGQLREELYGIGIQRMNEEETLAAIEEMRLVLEQTPPPPIATPPAAPVPDVPPPAADTGSTPEAPVAPAPPPPAAPEANTGMTHPMPAGRGNITSHFGPRTLDGFHWGIDWAAPGFPPILAAASGTVVRNGYNAGGWGYYIILSHMINGERVDTVYAHFHYQSSIAVGTIVSQGQVIGTQGNTGFSFGAHLHFEVHPGGFGWQTAVDPISWIPNP